MLMEVKWIPRDLYPSEWLQRWAVGRWNKRVRWGLFLREGEGVDPLVQTYTLELNLTAVDKNRTPGFLAGVRGRAIGWRLEMAVTGHEKVVEGGRGSSQGRKLKDRRLDESSHAAFKNFNRWGRDPLAPQKQRRPKALCPLTQPARRTTRNRTPLAACRDYLGVWVSRCLAIFIPGPVLLPSD
jgi:hypothetical protein